jgi:UDP-galactopyranose mutase
VLDHPEIRVSTGTPFTRDLLGDCGACFNSMPIDEYFEYAFGPLPYRSIRFHHRSAPADRVFGPNAQVNCTDAGPYTRHVDWSLLPAHVVRATGRKTLTLDEPCDYRENAFERYYPVPDSDGRNAALYRKYRALADAQPNLRFIGRCGAYRYLDMDQVVGQSLESAHAWLRGEAPVPDPQVVA